MDERIILHVDMDAFYAAIEQRDRPELRGRPVIVGGTPEGRGVVSAASYEARKFGIHSAMPAARAVRLCPHGVFLSVDMPKYRAVSRELMAVLSRHSERIEQISVDEAFLDLTGRAADYREAARIAREIKRQVKSELKLTASVGVGPNKFLAKLGSDHRKPDGLVVIRPEESIGFLAPLPVGKLWGIGPKTAARLEARGLRTIGSLAAAAPEQLRALLGAWAEVVRELARGIDERPVEPAREAKSASAEETFAGDLRERGAMQDALAELSRRVERRLRGEGARARTVTLRVRFGDFTTITRQTTLPEATDRAETLQRAAVALLSRVEAEGRGVRLLGVRASGLEHREQQLSLFDPRVPRRRQLDASLAYLQRRFGARAVRWAREASRDTPSR